MSDAKGLYRRTLPNGMEVAYVDKGIGKPFGLQRQRYEEQGYEPAFEALPTE